MNLNKHDIHHIVDTKIYDSNNIKHEKMIIFCIFWSQKIIQHLRLLRVAINGHLFFMSIYFAYMVSYTWTNSLLVNYFLIKDGR